MAISIRRGGKGKASLRKHLYIKTVAPMVPALVGQAAGLPPADPDRVAAEAADFILGGPAEIFFVMLGGALALNGLALITKGKLLSKMELEQQKEFLAKSFASKLWALRGLSVLAGLPMKVAYYNDDEVCRTLGYDRVALTEDALKHQVSREDSKSQG
ncbi:MAG: hypothetical protein ACYC55_00700 [Candidatus Geothermincolia bacterium]